MYISISKTLLTFDIKIPSLWLFHWPKTYSETVPRSAAPCAALLPVPRDVHLALHVAPWHPEAWWKRRIVMVSFAITPSTYQSTSTIYHHLPSSTIIPFQIYQNITIFLHPHIRVEQRSISNLQARHAGSRACVVASWFTASWTATGTNIFQTVDVSCVPWSLTVADLQQGMKNQPIFVGVA